MNTFSKFTFLLSGVLFFSACAVKNNTNPEGKLESKLKALAEKNTSMLTQEQAAELDAFWLEKSSGIFQQCRSQYPKDKKNISLVIETNLSGKVVNVWMLNGGQVGTCIVQDINTATMPKPPFEPFFSPLYAVP